MFLIVICPAIALCVVKKHIGIDNSHALKIDNSNKQNKGNKR